MRSRVRTSTGRCGRHAYTDICIQTEQVPGRSMPPHRFELEQSSQIALLLSAGQCGRMHLLRSAPASRSPLMPHSDSPSSQRPMLVSLTHAVLKVVGSLFLTVAILVVLVAILLWGTVVEKNYGATAAKFGIYGSWWFNGLGFILGLNSAAALDSPLAVEAAAAGLRHPACRVDRAAGGLLPQPALRDRSHAVGLRGRVQRSGLQGLPRSTSNSTANSNSA